MSEPRQSDDEHRRRHLHEVAHKQLTRRVHKPPGSVSDPYGDRAREAAAHLARRRQSESSGDSVQRALEDWRRQEEAHREFERLLREPPLRERERPRDTRRMSELMKELTNPWLLLVAVGLMGLVFADRKRAR